MDDGGRRELVLIKQHLQGIGVLLLVLVLFQGCAFMRAGAGETVTVTAPVRQCRPCKGTGTDPAGKIVTGADKSEPRLCGQCRGHGKVLLVGNQFMPIDAGTEAYRLQHARHRLFVCRSKIAALKQELAKLEKQKADAEKAIANMTASTAAEPKETPPPGQAEGVTGQEPGK